MNALLTREHRMSSRRTALLARTVLTIAVFVCSAAQLPAQGCPPELQGAWSGSVPAAELFEVRFVVRETAAGQYAAEVHAAGGTETVPVWRDGTHLRFQPSGSAMAFDGMIAADGNRIDAFINHRGAATRIVLTRTAEDDESAWHGRWSPVDVGEESLRLDLYVEDDGEGNFGGYWFFRDQRMPGLWGYGLSCDGANVSVGERTLGLWFTGASDMERDSLDLTAKGPGSSVSVSFGRVPPNDVPGRPDAPDGPPRPSGGAEFVARAPEALHDGWPTAAPADVGIDPMHIRALVEAIVAADTQWGLPHAVLVARHGTLVVEEYFYGYDRSTWQDMRSASKTVASTLVGLAIRDGHIPGVDTPALSLLHRYRSYERWDPRKAEITVADLMNMNSGLDANDYDPNAVAAEQAYQSQTARQDWVKYALDAPMVGDPGAPPFYYGGANPLIVGGVLDQTVGEPVQWFADRNLFAPLGIDHYKILLDPTGVPYLGGGLRLRPRDMLTFGQLYLNGGVWNGQRVLSEAWVDESWTPRGKLQQFRAEHAYGYFWWHFPYRVGDRVFDAIEARGNGGQYISVFPSLDLVVVITGGNYRNGKVRVPERMLAEHILPAVLEADATNR